jgi:hypothetical protein
MFTSSNFDASCELSRAGFIWNAKRPGDAEPPEKDAPQV